MSRIVLPGDFIIDQPVSSNLAPKLIGFGLEKRSDGGVYAVTAGVLHETENKIWLDTAPRRFIFIKNI